MSSFLTEINNVALGSNLEKPLVKIGDVEKNKIFKIVSLKKVYYHKIPIFYDTMMIPSVLGRINFWCYNHIRS